jgi:hypothetical protein
MTYPTSLTIPQGTNATALDPANWNVYVNQINAIAADLVAVRTEIETFSGVDHTAAQAVDVTTALGSIRHMLKHLSGESDWLTAPGGSLKVHSHAVEQGGLLPYASLGPVNIRKIDLYPQYPGSLQTNSLRGTSISGNNIITVTTIENVASYVARHAYNGISAQSSLQDAYITVRFTLPKDFTAWTTSNGIQIEYKTDSALYTDCHVDAYVYKSGIASIVTSSEDNVNVSWSNFGISAANLGSWSANDIIELYLKLESRNNYAANIGRIALNYTS